MLMGYDGEESMALRSQAREDVWEDCPSSKANEAVKVREKFAVGAPKISTDQPGGTLD